MKLLLDECLPVDFRHLITGHDAFTVVYKGWKGIKNGRLLALAAADQFEALITTDAGIQFQQNQAALPLAVVILDAVSNDIEDLRPLVPGLLTLLTTLTPNAISHVR